MPAPGAMFPDIPVSHYFRQPERLQKRISVPWGDPQINEPHPFIRQHIEWNSEWFTPAQIDQVELWFEVNATTYFSIYDNHGWVTRAIPKTIFATVVALQLAYTMPAKELAGLSLYDNTATLIAPSRYTLAAGAGVEGEDVVTFVSSGQLPPAGHTLSYAATAGRRKWTVWCVTERFPSRATGEGDLYTLSEPLQFVTRMGA